MKPQRLIFTNHVAQQLDQFVDTMSPSRVFVLVDSNTALQVLPRLQAGSTAVGSAEIITVKAGDMHKTLDSAGYIWGQLTERGCTRGSVIINVGGGVITDMGAFVASTFKRGVPFVNLPTTLLGAVDASVGGKTGVNFCGLKNQIGVFSNADLVIISTTFFNTLPLTELRSGYAEMIKHALIDSPVTYRQLLGLRVGDIAPDRLLGLLRQSVEVKTRIVEADPTEQGLRRALNLGHTFAHAFEALAMSRQSPMAHGYAVAHGLVCATIMSHMLLGFDSAEVNRLAQYVREVYGEVAFDCDDYDRLLGYMSHDKKVDAFEQYNFTLLRAVGDVVTDCHPTRDDITATLDIYRDKMSRL